MNNQRIHTLLSIVVGLLVIWLINQVADRFRFRLDMTEEKRYSVSEATKSTLQSLDNDVFIEVFLTGNLPSNFQRFQKSIAETLDEFAIYGNVQFKFTDPSQAGNEEARNRFYQSLVQRGIQPTNLNDRRDGQSSQQLIFPGAIVSVGAKESAVNLLSGNRTTSNDEVINESIEGLEYEFVHAIRSLIENRKRVGIVTDHGAPDSTQLAGLTGRILKKYDLFNVRLTNRNGLLIGYDAIVLPKPTEAFNAHEKYYLDQYVMRGGKLLVFYDALRVNMDSASGEGTIALPYETNLDDLMFRWGVRINKNYVLDLNSGTTVVVTGNFGEKPQLQLLPWPFFPVVTNFGNHPSVKGLDATLLRFASSIDTVKAVGIKKTPLLKTSERTKVISPPVKVAYNDLQGPLQPEFFNGGTYNFGYLLEGKFKSFYKNRFPPKGIDKSTFKEDGEFSRIVVISDGDIIRNEFDLESGKPLDIGVDPYAEQNYANGELVTRLLDYLTDEDGLVMVRAKEIKIRPLDKVRVKEEKVKWQMINVVLPLVLIVLLGGLKYYLRKKKFTD
ncbi:MAG: gliding motility-associated ABC transporter substrate-binding protein GldG [Cytophagales bacterium]|nr:gliding motility-associated ABC transporter substrate-binding protein GldG [Cytophagales bacterium]